MLRGCVKNVVRGRENSDRGKREMDPRGVRVLVLGEKSGGNYSCKGEREDFRKVGGDIRKYKPEGTGKEKMGREEDKVLKK